MAKGIRRLLDRALNNVNKQIHYASEPLDDKDIWAGALASEGYNGGYADALKDVDLALSGVLPRRNGWWEK